MGSLTITPAVAVVMMATALFVDHAARAQNAPSESVLSRPRPEFEPNGLAVRDFV